MQTKNPVVWFEIYTENLQRAKKFYETILNVELIKIPAPPSEENFEMLGFPMDEKGSGASGALVKMEGVKPGNNSTLIYFDSEDCSTEENRIDAAGGKVLKPKESIGEYGFIVLAQDTEGNMFGIHSQA